MHVSELTVFNERQDGWTPAAPAEAFAMLDEASAYCRRRCPIFEECIEAACLVFRLEQTATAFIKGEGSAVGVLDEPTIGIV